MSTLVWNCLGLGNPQTVKILRLLTKEKWPNLVFLVETKSRKKRMEEVMRILKMDGCFAVDCVGLSGRIALLWKEAWQVNIINYTRWHISALIKERNNGPTWQFIGFYGHPDTAKRSSSWQLLKMLKPPSPMAWMCAGDFNEILHQNEKVGGASRPYKQIEVFRLAVEACGLNDIHSQRLWFTWSNNRSGMVFTKERIDRALANKEWNEEFKKGSCTALATIRSDHSPLIIENYKGGNRGKKGGRCFRCEVAWEMRGGCMETITKAWKTEYGRGCDARVLRQKLDACQKDLIIWKQKSQKESQLSTLKGMAKIGHLQSTGIGDHLIQMKRVQKEVEVSLAVKDLKWRQRAKQHWLKHGDKNTQYFHMQASQRRKTNAIQSVEDTWGRVVTEQTDIGDVFTRYFSSLFTTSHPSKFEECLVAMDTKLTVEMKGWLMTPFTERTLELQFFK
ncbi:uncharacterized protein LOC121255187 [Juglans microcarpa x Juglans regia]|uniref:uncharacterized protein LOC121255187 n=1 Tax=Juglans microcarpa x Juglans regia TaxID=2249226 RepID=UPI001B7D9972|nr:uncharacterized protein LOC121255187 [Juglans microcarpa x Juglans regia]